MVGCQGLRQHHHTCNAGVLWQSQLVEVACQPVVMQQQVVQVTVAGGGLNQGVSVGGGYGGFSRSVTAVGGGYGGSCQESLLWESSQQDCMQPEPMSSLAAAADMEAKLQKWPLKRLSMKVEERYSGRTSPDYAYKTYTVPLRVTLQRGRSNTGF